MIVAAAGPLSCGASPGSRRTGSAGAAGGGGGCRVPLEAFRACAHGSRAAAALSTLLVHAAHAGMRMTEPAVTIVGAPRIGAKLGRSVRTVRRHRRQLRDLGLLWSAGHRPGERVDRWVPAWRVCMAPAIEQAAAAQRRQRERVVAAELTAAAARCPPAGERWRPASTPVRPQAPPTA